MLINEIMSNPYITIERDESSAEGYIVTSPEQIPNWLQKNGYHNEKLIKRINEFDTVCFFTNMYVAEENRGQGVGNYLVESFIEQASSNGADVIYLSADTSDEQAEGFDLIKWYKKWGWEIIDSTTSYPLMEMIL